MSTGSRGSTGEEGPLEARLRSEVAEKLVELTAQLEALEMRKSAQALRQLWVLGNQYLTEAAPWTAVKTDRDRAAVSVRMGLNLVALFARVSQPFIPFTCESVAAAIGEPAGAAWPVPEAALDLLPAGREVRAPEVLFRKVEAEQVEAWRARFGGPEGE